MDVNVEVQVRSRGAEVDGLREAKALRVALSSAERCISGIESSEVDVHRIWSGCQRRDYSG